MDVIGAPDSMAKATRANRPVAGESRCYFARAFTPRARQIFGPSHTSPSAFVMGALQLPGKSSTTGRGSFRSGKVAQPRADRRRLGHSPPQPLSRRSRPETRRVAVTCHPVRCDIGLDAHGGIGPMFKRTVSLVSFSAGVHLRHFIGGAFPSYFRKNSNVTVGKLLFQSERTHW